MMLYPLTIADSHASLRFVKSGCIIVALGTNDNSYFVKNGQILGYQFDLIQKYSKKIGRNPVFIVEEDVEKRLGLLLSNGVDIAVCDTKDSIPEYKGVNFIHIDDEISSSIWAVSNINAGFSNNIDSWLKSYKKTNEYGYLTSYYSSDKGEKYESTQISEYDSLIQKYSKQIGWDWRLIASVIYQESRFIPTVKSRKGAVGLMQLVPKTITFLGFDNITSNEKNIEAGTKLIKYLEDYYSQDSNMIAVERTKFVLAAYNSGHGKIDICRRNTELHGYNPNRWVDVAAINSKTNKNELKLSNKFFLSRETILFVNEILERYVHYKNLFPEIISYSELFSILR